jgi:hypothetical protein
LREFLDLRVQSRFEVILPRLKKPGKPGKPGIALILQWVVGAGFDSNPANPAQPFISMACGPKIA